MKKSLQEIKSLSKIGKRLALIVDVKDYEFAELLDMAKITALLGWNFTFKNAANLSVDELQTLLTHADEDKLIFEMLDHLYYLL
jgi:hypothetical protein